MTKSFVYFVLMCVSVAPSQPINERRHDERMKICAMSCVKYLLLLLQKFTYVCIIYSLVNGSSDMWPSIGAWMNSNWFAIYDNHHSSYRNFFFIYFSYIYMYYIKYNISIKSTIQLRVYILRGMYWIYDHNRACRFDVYANVPSLMCAVWHGAQIAIYFPFVIFFHYIDAIMLCGCCWQKKERMTTNTAMNNLCIWYKIELKWRGYHSIYWNECERARLPSNIENKRVKTEWRQLVLQINEHERKKNICTIHHTIREEDKWCWRCHWPVAWK